MNEYIDRWSAIAACFGAFGLGAGTMYACVELLLWDVRRLRRILAAEARRVEGEKR